MESLERGLSLVFSWLVAGFNDVLCFLEHGGPEWPVHVQIKLKPPGLVNLDAAELSRASYGFHQIRSALKRALFGSEKMAVLK